LAVISIDFGAGEGAGVGKRELLKVAEDPEVDPVGIVLGTAPEVKAVGEEGVMLGLDEDEDDDSWAALAEVLAFGIFIFGKGAAAVVIGGLAEVVLVRKGCAWSGMNSAVLSAVVMLSFNSVITFTGCVNFRPLIQRSTS
jgi:hypothetical protein